MAVHIEAAASHCQPQALSCLFYGDPKVNPNVVVIACSTSSNSHVFGGFSMITIGAFA